MGGVCEVRSEKSRGERKLERKGQQRGPMGTKVAYSRVTTRPASPLQSGNQRKNKNYCKFVMYMYYRKCVGAGIKRMIDLLNVKCKNKIN